MHRTILWVLSTVVLSFLTASVAQAASLPAAPTLIAPTEHDAVATALPMITGVAHADLRVAVYINDVFNGYANTISEENGVQSFAYQPFLPLGVGMHMVMVRAEDLTAGTRSDKSDPRMFHVVDPLPAPTVLGTVVNDDSTASRPFVVGVAPAGTTVTVTIDGVGVGTTTASDHASGTGDFALRAPSTLSAGWHAVTATATEPTGWERTSRLSERTSILIAAPATTTTEAVAATPASDPVTAPVEATTPETTEPTNSDEPTPSVGPAAETSDSPVTEDTTNTPADVADEPNESAGDNENGEDPAAASSESDTNDNDEASSTTAASDDEDNLFELLGWIALLIVAATVVARARRRRRGDTSDVTFSPTTAPKESSGHSNSSGPLDLHAPKENNNITVIKHDDSSENN